MCVFQGLTPSHCHEVGILYALIGHGDDCPVTYRAHTTPLLSQTCSLHKPLQATGATVFGAHLRSPSECQMMDEALSTPARHILDAITPHDRI